MRNEFLPLSKPSISQTDIDAVSDVLRSGWITTGQKNSAFEEAFCQSVGCSQAVALSSATAGMHLALKALDIGPSDEIITPSMTWVSTVNQIVLAGAKPVFVDIDRDTLMISADAVAPLITERTKAIIPVHFAGASVDITPLRALATQKGIPLIEDAAHALGTTYQNEHIGQQGTAIFSFHPIKNITTGEGGMICSDDQAFLDRIRRLKFHGLGVDAYDRQTQGRAPQAQVLEPGFKYNLPDILAVLGIGQLSRLKTFNARRTTLAQYYLKHLQDIEEITPLNIPQSTSTHAWHLFIIRLDIEKAGMTRDAFMEALKTRNIGTGLHFKPVHTQTYYQNTMPSIAGTLTNTEWNGDRICSLPLYPDMTEQDADDVIQAIKDTLSHGR